MSSTSLELVPTDLLESGMDFRDNWLAQFRAVVDQEIRDAGGDVVAGRTAVADKVEMREQTIYQYYFQKSGKTFPSAELMVMIEKKYGDGRPSGWSAQPLPSNAIALPQRPRQSIGDMLYGLSQQLIALDDDQQEKAVQLFTDFAKSPDSGIRLKALVSLLGGAAESEEPGRLKQSGGQ